MANHQLPKSIVVAISGGGRSLENLIQKQSNYKVIGVITSTIHCKGMQIAKDAQLPIFAGDFKHGGKDLESYLEHWLNDLGAEWIVLGGFLKKFPVFPQYKNKIINIHPALLPKYGGKGMYGMRVHKAVKNAEEKMSGATVHFLNEEYDEGKIISQISLNLNPKETAEEIAKKVFSAECILLPHVIENLIAGKLPLANGVEVLTYEP